MSRRIKNIFYFLSFIGSGYGGLVLLRNRNAGADYSSDQTLYGKVAVITGANTGVGKEVAMDLSKRGARVIMACRDMKKCEKARDEIIKFSFNKNIECIECDLASLESIKKFTEKIRKDEKFLHLLINNAAVMWTPKSYTKEGFEMQLGVNFLGHFYLTAKLLDLLKRTPDSRIVNVSCKTYRIGYINFDDLNSSKHYDEKFAYNQSKLANVLLTLKLKEVLQDTDVSVYTADPGYVSSDILRHSSFGKSNLSATVIGPFFTSFTKTPAKGAQTISYCCLEPNLESGKYYRDLTEVAIEGGGLNKEDARRLWAIAEKWTRIK